MSNAFDELKFIIKNPGPNIPMISGAKKIGTLDILRKDPFLGGFYVHEWSYLCKSLHEKERLCWIFIINV